MTLSRPAARAAARRIALAAAAVVLALSTRSCDTAAAGALLRLRGSARLDGRLMLVDLQRWPRPRSELAKAVDALGAAGARAIALDVLLDLVEPSGPRSEPESRSLAEAMARSGRVLVPSHIREDTKDLVDPAALFGCSPQACGFADFRQLDGVTWKCWLQWRGRLSFALLAALALEGRTPDAISRAPDGRLAIDGVPLAARGEGSAVWINYIAHSPPPDQLLPLDDVLATAARDPKLLEELFGGKLVLVGRLTPDATGISREDLFRTPVRHGSSFEMPGVLIHANLVHALVRRELLDFGGPWAAALGGFSGLAAAALALSQRAAAPAAFALAGLLAAWACTLWLAFATAGQVLPAASLPTGLAVAVVAHVAARLRAVPRALARQAALRGLRVDRLAILRIESRSPEQGRVRYGFQLDYQETALAPAGSPSAEYLAFARHRAAVVESCDQLTRERLQELEREVGAIGRRIQTELFGPEMGPRIERVAADFMLLDVDEAEVEVPWELARAEGSCLGERLAVGRRLLLDGGAPATPRQPVLGPLRLLVIANPTAPGMPTLPDAEDEARELSALAATFPGTVTSKSLVGHAATLEGLQAELKSGVDLLHFSGHSRYVRESAGQSGLVFPEGVLNPDNLRALVGNAPPFVIYLNSCESAKVTQQGSWGMQGRMHLPRAFVQSGVQLFIGSLWQIEDTVARAVALRFYEELFHGLPVGTALSLAKRSVKNEWMTQAAYVLYGDPRVTLGSLRTPHPPAGGSDIGA